MREPQVVWTPLVVWYVLVITLSSFLLGYSVGLLSTCQDLVTVHFGWCGEVGCLPRRTRQALVNSILFLGAAGSPIVPKPVGSRQQLIFGDIFLAGGGALCALSLGFWELVLGRFVSGIGLGIISVAAPQFLFEISPQRHHGVLSTLHSVFIAVGILVSYAAGLPQFQRHWLLEDWWWRVLFGVAAGVALCQMCFLCLFVLDSPTTLLLQGRRLEAKSVFYRLAGRVASEESDKLLELHFYEMSEQCRLAQDSHQPLVQGRSSSTRSIVRLAFFLSALNQLNGINYFVAFSNDVFSQVGFSAAQSTCASVVMASANVLSASFAGVPTGLGRHRVLVLGVGFQAVSLAVLGLSLTQPSVSLPSWAIGPLAVLCVIVFTVSFTLGVGSVTWLYLDDLPLQVRSSVLCWACSVNWCMSFAVVFGGGLLSLSRCCAVFGSINLVGAGVCLCLAGPSETSVERDPFDDYCLAEDSN